MKLDKPSLRKAALVGAAAGAVAAVALQAFLGDYCAYPLMMLVPIGAGYYYAHVSTDSPSGESRGGYALGGAITGAAAAAAGGFVTGVPQVVSEFGAEGLAESIAAVFALGLIGSLAAAAVGAVLGAIGGVSYKRYSWYMSRRQGKG